MLLEKALNEALDDSDVAQTNDIEDDYTASASESLSMVTKTEDADALEQHQTYTQQNA